MNNTWKTYMLTLISFLVGTTQFVIVGILDKIAASVGVPTSTAGQLSTVFSFAYAIGTPIVMATTAKLDRRRQLLWGFGILLTGIVATLVLPGFGCLLVSRVILGIGAGVITVVSYAMAAKLASPGRQAGAMSNVTLGFSAALVFGVPIGRMAGAAYDWRMIFLILGVLSLLAVFAVVRMLPALTGEAPAPIGRQFALLKKTKIAVAFSLTLLMFFSYSVVYTYIAPFLNFLLLLSEQEMSGIFFALGLASLLGSKLGGFLADRIGTLRTLAGGLAVQALALALLSGVSGPVVVVILLLMVWMLAAFTFMPAQTLNLVALAPEASGIMLSLNGSFVQFGFALGAGAGGIASGVSSVMAVGWIGAALAAIAAGGAVFGLAGSLPGEEQQG
jgi:DHA1 family putative efflux transporter-like MFS transporter